MQCTVIAKICVIPQLQEHILITYPAIFIGQNKVKQFFMQNLFFFYFDVRCSQTISILYSF